MDNQNGKITLYYVIWYKQINHRLIWINTDFTFSRLIPNWGGGSFPGPARLFPAKALSTNSLTNLQAQIHLTWLKSKRVKSSIIPTCSWLWLQCCLVEQWHDLANWLLIDKQLKVLISNLHLDLAQDCQLLLPNIILWISGTMVSIIWFLQNLLPTLSLNYLKTNCH